VITSLREFRRPFVIEFPEALNQEPFPQQLGVLRSKRKPMDV